VQNYARYEFFGSRDDFHSTEIREIKDARKKILLENKCTYIVHITHPSWGKFVLLEGRERSKMKTLFSN